MLDYSNCKLEKVAVHQVGNKTNGEELELSKSLLDIEDEKIKSTPDQFFLSLVFQSGILFDYFQQ
jgi:hypothetical protein